MSLGPSGTLPSSQSRLISEAAALKELSGPCMHAAGTWGGMETELASLDE